MSTFINNAQLRSKCFLIKYRKKPFHFFKEMSLVFYCFILNHILNMPILFLVSNFLVAQNHNLSGCRIIRAGVDPATRETIYQAHLPLGRQQGLTNSLINSGKMRVNDTVGNNGRKVMR